MSGHPATQPAESPKAAAAFAAYVELGPGRSLAALAAKYVEQKQYKSSTTAKSQLARWSVQFHWQERLAAAASQRAERLLEQAAEIDADSFFKSSIQLNKAITSTVRNRSDDIRGVIAIRESVRKPAVKGGTSVSVNVDITVEQRRIIEQIAQSRGLDPDELMREVMSEVDDILHEAKR